MTDLAGLQAWSTATRETHQMSRMRLHALCTLLLLGCAGVAQADVFRPAYLEVRENGPNRYDVLWKLPVQGDMRRLAPRLEPGAAQRRLQEVKAPAH